jgi:hypothetical protein
MHQQAPASRRDGPKIFTANELRRIKERKEAGVSWKDIARGFGLADSVIRKAFASVFGAPKSMPLGPIHTAGRCKFSVAKNAQRKNGTPESSETSESGQDISESGGLKEKRKGSSTFTRSTCARKKT